MAHTATNAYNNWGAYVHGGASQKLAKAITSAAMTHTSTNAYNNWGAYVHGGASQNVAEAITTAVNTRATNVCAKDAQRPVLC